MKLIKMLGLAAITALAAMAVVGASSASAAALKVESCMTKAPTECKQVGAKTTFVGTSTSVTLSNGTVTNTCKKNQVGGTVIDSESAEGAGEADKISAEITSQKFEECTFPTEVSGLPWLLLTWDTLFLASSTGLIERFPGGASPIIVVISVFGVKCKYEDTATIMPIGTWKNGTPSTITLGGELKSSASNSFLCGTANGKISGSFSVSSVSDPGLPEANNIQILK